MVFQKKIQFATSGRGSENITTSISQALNQSGIQTGTCHVFVMHTSASLMLCENADPTVRTDLERFMQRLVPDGDSLFQHTDEGPDDMPAHIRAILTNVEVTLPVTKGQLALGIWQGLYLWEHRTHAHQRAIMITIQGQ